LRHDFFWHRELQVEMPSEGRWSQRTWVRPLLEVLEEHDRYVVVLTDKQRARILTVDAGGMEQQAEILSDVPNKHVTTGTDHIWSQTQMERDHAQHVKWHVERVVGELTAIIDRTKISRVVIGGPVEATSTLAAELPKRIQQMVIGTLSTPLDASYERLVNEMREVQQRAEQEDEVKMVEGMITAAMKGDRAVLGIDAVLLAIQEARVYRMIVTRDYRVEGKECDSCHVLAVEAGDACQFCGGKMTPVPDLINRASHRVLDLSGKVQVVTGEAAQNLAEHNIGAVLRF
jgi:peptide subunit release factor 1 (eRF1)